MSNRIQRRAKISQTIKGTVKRPRLVVFRSNKFFYAQLTDDVKGHPIAAVDKIADPQEAGKKLAKIAAAKKVPAVIFDRAGYKYHGQVKKFADAAREGGLKF